MTVQTKSGSNSIHGSAYDFRTGNANLAREPFSQPPTPGVIPPGLKNKFGGSIGGRVIRDRLFYFGSYEGQRQKVGTSEVNTLPSQLLTETCLGNKVGPSGIAGCDFSEYLANLPTGQGQIFNNTSGSPVAYPGNVIPAAMVSTQFKNLLTVLEPFTKLETGGALNGLDGNSKGSGTGLFNSDMWTTRVDDTISQRMNAFVRFSRWTNTLSGAQMYGPAGGPGFGIGGYGGQSTSADDSVAVGTDYVFNPKLITDLRLGYLRYNINDQKNDQGTEFANTLGIPGINLGTTITGGSPGFLGTTLAGGAHQPLWGDGLGVSRCNCPLIEREDQFQIVNNWTKTIGNHSVKIGGDLRYGRNLRVPSDNDRAGVLNFGTGPTSSNGSDGLGFATMALGDVTSFNRYVSTSTNAKEFQKRVFFYAQDTWRASSKLTLNLGVRWELYFPETVNGPGNGSLMNLNDGYLHVAGVGGIGSNMDWQLNKKKQFEPRIGVAYQVNPQTVVRAGYGRSFDLGVFGSIFGHTVTQNLPVLANQSISNAADSITGEAFCLGSPAENPGCIQDNVAAGQPKATGGPVLYTPPAVPSSGLLPNPGSTVGSKARPNPLQFPTLDAWNLSVQRALTPTLSLTIAYVGNKGTHTLSDGDGNNTNPNEAAISLPGQSKIGSTTLGSINGQTLHWDPRAPSVPDATGATSNQTYLERYYGGKLAACSDPAYAPPIDSNLPGGLPAGSCGWSQSIQYDGDDQNTNFNALQVTLAQQQWKGLAVTANYQWASAFDSNSQYATWSKRVAYGRDSNVRQNAATLYGSYDLPFGKGKMFAPGVNRATDLLIGGYELSGTLNMSSGLPWSPNINCKFSYTAADGTMQTANDLPSSAPCYPNKTGARMSTHASSFDPTSATRTFFQAQTLGGGIFSDAGLDNIGNNGRNTYWGPGFYNTDLSLQKSFQIWEKVNMKFRFDAYNAVNHINPGLPSTNVLSAGTITGEAPGPGPRYLEFSLKTTF
ncbi:TonB-dependent receptor domain-containing protein [Acidicapsa ligni]